VCVCVCVFILLLVDRPSLLGSGAQTAYALDDFKEEVYGGKVRQRIEVMLARGIAVTDEVCVKRRSAHLPL
jgi:hypothetical protein